MRITASILLITVLISVLPVLAFAEVRVTLKNGREIVADSCREANGKLICNMLGGTFEFDQDEMANLKEAPNKYRKTVQPAPDEAITGEEKPLSGAGEPERKIEDKNDSAKKGEGVLIRGTNPEAEKRLDQINQRKAELNAEREKLTKEREQLFQEIRDADTVTKKEQLEEMRNRHANLGERIIKFNEEVNRINEEAKHIIESLKK